MWWKKAVVYQIYPRSFNDTNNDGIGDIRGIINKLDYIKYLGANVIWLCPVYKTPNKDNGYDISDYKSINLEYGTLDDMVELIEKAKEKNIYIMMDIVANHTSSKHPWFKEAIKSKKNKYHDFYVFKESKNGKKPSELKSIFLEDAWSLNQETNEYYLHMFSKEQVDLNWDNKEVRFSIYDILEYWIKLGICGFRFDVIDMISKDIDHLITGDGPHLHEYIHEMNDRVLSKYDLITVGETWSANVEKAKKYSNLDGSEFSMIFNFNHVLLDQEKEKWDLKQLNLMDLKLVFEQQQVELYNVGWNSLFWNNHDLPRVISRWGNDKTYREKSGKMLATLLHFMQGTPYIYQGEEIGMINYPFTNKNQLRDIESFNMLKDRLQKGYELDDIFKSLNVKGRDNARTPMQWSNLVNAGFSATTPWIDVHPQYKEINVDKAIENQSSILHYYRRLIHLRRFSRYADFIEKANFKLIHREHPYLFAYKRQYKKMTMIIYCNFYNQSFEIENIDQVDHVVISNDDIDVSKDKISLKPYDAIVMIVKS